MTKNYVSSDGSPVEVYLALPKMGEAELIHAASCPNASILDLGCGVGRISNALIDLHHQVTAVDNCEEMLKHVEGAKTILCDIESLNIQKTFDTVVLASHFINGIDRYKNMQFLEVCKKHLAVNGVIIVQRYALDLLSKPNYSRKKMGNVYCSFQVKHVDSIKNIFSAKVEYKLGNKTWEQIFEAKILDDEEFICLANSAGLYVVNWLDDKRTWAALKENNI